jgi:Ca-activated chloride channel family protein
VFEFDYLKAPPSAQKTSFMPFILGVATVGLTLGFLAFGTSFFISVIQGRMLGSDAWLPPQAGRMVLSALCAGLAAGLVGQAMLEVMSPHLGASGGKMLKVVAWVIVGGMLGFAFSLIIPNLDRAKAVLGGLIGGVMAGIVLTQLPGVVGRLLACLILGGAVGLSVAVVEAMAREGYLRVIWGPGEFTTVNLGATPVTVGTGVESTVKIPKSSGFPATIATFTMRDGKAVMFHNMTGATHPLRDGNKLPLGTVTIEVKLFS